MSTWLATHRPFQIVLAVLAALLLPTAALVALAYSLTDIPGPAGSGYFGQTVTVLPNGNFVVTDPLWDNGVVTDVGAVYLYDGVTHQLISRLVGSTAGDQVGSHGISSLTNSNYVVRSPYWSNVAATQAGAVTVCSGTAGCRGAVTQANSLVGSTAGDHVGSVAIGGVTALSNGNFVVASASWHNGAVGEVGAVTWCSGTAGCTGVVTTTNSLVGSQAFDFVGQNGVTALSNGNYAVDSASWHNGAGVVLGAVTWCNGTLACTGIVTTSNSLVGSTASGLVGMVTALSNGNYVVFSPDWNNGWAVTWCNGTVACTGVVTTSNSLVSSTPGTLVDVSVIPLNNGNYVIDSYDWQNGADDHAGAVTWCSGTTGCQGVVTTTNSLVGSTTDDYVGRYGVTPLSNGNYVVRSDFWNNGAATFAGAVTWCSGTTGCQGAVTTTNSLVGKGGDNVGLNGVTALNNGNYVVASSGWSNGADAAVGAVTWCGAPSGCTGIVTTTNSLVGSTPGDNVGAYSATALSNGNYVVNSPYWTNGAASQVGAVTWCSAAGGCIGVVTTTNSLVGGTAFDTVGNGGIKALNNGNYIVASPLWSNGVITGAGAATWCRGTAACIGVVTTTNSLVGSQAFDAVGSGGVMALSNGNYVVFSPHWSRGAATFGVAVTLGNGATGVVGPINADNSVLGTNQGVMVWADDSIDDQIVVGRPNDKIVSLLGLFKLYLPLTRRP